MNHYYKSKIDWWVYFVLAIMMCGCFFGLLSEGLFAGGIILCAGMLALWLFAVTGVRYGHPRHALYGSGVLRCVPVSA